MGLYLSDGPCWGKQWSFCPLTDHGSQLLCHPNVGLPHRCAHIHTHELKSSPMSNSICLTYWTLQEHRLCDAIGRGSAVSVYDSLQT